MSFDPAAIQALDTTGTAPQMWLTATKIVYDSFLAKAWKLPYLQAAYSISRPPMVILWNQTCHIAGHFSDFMAHASPRLWLCACMAGEAWKSQTQLPSFHIRSYRVHGITLAWHPYCPKCRASPKSQIFKIPFLLQITSRMKASASWSKLQSSTFLQTPFPNFKWKLETPAEFPKTRSCPTKCWKSSNPDAQSTVNGDAPHHTATDARGTSSLPQRNVAGRWVPWALAKLGDKSCGHHHDNTSKQSETNLETKELVLNVLHDHIDMMHGVPKHLGTKN